MISYISSLTHPKGTTETKSLRLSSSTSGSSSSYIILILFFLFLPLRFHFFRFFHLFFHHYFLLHNLPFLLLFILLLRWILFFVLYAFYCFPQITDRFLSCQSKRDSWDGVPVRFRACRCDWQVVPTHGVRRTR